MDRFLKLGRFLLAIPMIVYGVEHFMYAEFVATIVPPWIPWRPFWVYFTGCALIAAGASILVKKKADLAATLLGTMIFLFVALIHVFLLFHKPDDTWAGRAVFGDLPGRLNNAFKDFGLSGAAFIFAGTMYRSSRRSTGDALLTIGRIILGISITAFGVLHFVYPAFAPGIPPMFTSVAFRVPGRLFWVYLTAVIFVMSGASILLKKEVRLAAELAGIVVIVFALLTWAPVIAGNPTELIGNWLKDLGDAGGLLILASAFPRRSAVEEAQRQWVGERV
jgi:putative oxidoreductase